MLNDILWYLLYKNLTSLEYINYYAFVSVHKSFPIWKKKLYRKNGKPNSHETEISYSIVVIVNVIFTKYQKKFIQIKKKLLFLNQ